MPRVLHAIQQGDRRVLAEALPDRYKRLGKVVDSNITMPRADAMRVSDSVLAAGLGGERAESAAAKLAIDLWTRVYTFVTRTTFGGSLISTSRPCTALSLLGTYKASP